jgi:drug/metabolite transporter (DMT)-like permease
VRRSSITVQFVLTGIVWGSSFLFIAVALTGLTPGQVAWGRLVLGASALGLVVLVRRERLPRGVRVWLHLTVLAVAFCVLPFLLFAWAQQHVASSLASIYNATTPIMTAVMAWAVFRVERLRPTQLAGILLGVIGVAVISGVWRGLDAPQSLIAQGALLAATACYGFGLSYMRRFLANTGVSALSFSFSYIAVGALVMIALTPVVAWSPVRWDPWVFAAILMLGCLGTGIAYIWNQNTLRSWGPTRASTVTYITPVVGVILGIAVLGERVTWNEPVGALVVFAGILLAQGRLRLPRRRDEGRMPQHPPLASPEAGDPAEIRPEGRPAGRARS